MIVNRIDELSQAEVDEAVDLVCAAVPDVPVVRMSALSGEGFDDLLEMLDRKGAFGRRILDIDYDVYAEGEAELGWLNSHFRVEGQRLFPLDDLVMDIVERLRESLASREAETAHIKAIGMWNGFHGVANLTSSDSQVELSVRSACRTQTADVIVNARVAVSPELLERQTDRVANEACDAVEATACRLEASSLRPGRPVPTYRFSEPLG